LNKGGAFIIALLGTILVASIIAVIRSPSERESVTIGRVIDGDTLVTTDGRTLRLLNINTPEKGALGFVYAKEQLSNLLNQSVEIEGVGLDKYRRWLVRLYTPSYRNLQLVADGAASKFLVEEEEREQFATAEEIAITSERGMWKHSTYYGCFESRIEHYREYLVLTNNCNPILILNWTLKDESRKTYRFGAILLGNVTLYTSTGQDNAADLFWNSKTSIWNDDRDSLYLFDDEGKIVHYATYGYYG